MTDYPMMVLICEGSGLIPAEVRRTPSGRKSRSRMPSISHGVPIAPIAQILAVAYFPSPTPKYMFTPRGGALEYFMEGHGTLTTAPALRSGKAMFFQIVDYNCVMIQGGVVSLATGWSLRRFDQTAGRDVIAGERMGLRFGNESLFQVFIQEAV